MRMDWQQLKSSVMQALVLRKTCCHGSHHGNVHDNHPDNHHDNHNGDSMTACSCLEKDMLPALLVCKKPSTPSCQYHSINYIYVVMSAPAARFCPD